MRFGYELEIGKLVESRAAIEFPRRLCGFRHRACNDSANERNECSDISNKSTDSNTDSTLIRHAPPADGHVAEEYIIATEYGDSIKPPDDAISGRQT